MRKPMQPVSQDAKKVMTNYQKEKAKKYGMNYIEPTQPKWFVSYPFLIAIMAVLQVLCTIYGRKFTVFFGFNIAVGSLIFLPLVLYTFQIIAECYGWQYSRQVVWCNFIVNGIITIATLLVSYITFSPTTHENLRIAYVDLMDTMWVSALVLWWGIFISDFIVSWLMCQARFQLRGRFMLIRMIILHIISELIVASGMFISLHYNHYSVYDSIVIFANTIIARTIMSVMLLPVAKFIIWYIQHKVEEVVVFDYRIDFNPFKFGINPADSVHFNADGWDKIDSGKIDVKKMAQAYSSGILEEQHQKLADSINSRNPDLKKPG